MSHNLEYPFSCNYKRIAGITLRKGDYTDKLILNFEDGTGIYFQDSGQSCCESRYMNCDDNLDYHVGARFLGAEISEIHERNDEGWGNHDIDFLIITTDKGKITVANHNRHNGYYGGFHIESRFFEETPNFDENDDCEDEY
jgi:hypothetical protein